MRIVAIVAFLLFVGLANSSFAIESCRCIAIRLDDVQDYWLDNVQVDTINAFKEKNTALTVGIIGNYFGNDSKIVNLIKERSHTHPMLEIANHGWNHEDFTKFSEKQQSQLLNKTDQKIYKILGIHPSGFIPPYDLLNNDSIKALNENNLLYVSANMTTDPPPYYFHGAKPYRFPEMAEGGGINRQHTQWISSTYKETYAQALKSMLGFGYAVIVIHPQDFAIRKSSNDTNHTNPVQVEEIKKLIDKIHQDGFRLVTISQIPQNANFYELHPKWMNNVVNWYSEKKISDEEFINSFEFLKDRGLVVFNPK